MLALRKMYPDGCLPVIQSTGLHAFNNVMIFKVPDELRKPGEPKYQLATLDPTKDDSSWPADKYVKQLFPDYPMKKAKEEKCDEEKESVISTKSDVKKVSKTKDSTRNEVHYNKDKKHYQKHTKHTVPRNSYQRPYYKQRRPLLRDNRRYHVPKPLNADDIDPWLRPAIPERIIPPALIVNQPPAEPIFLRPEPNVIHPPPVPFYNQPFNGNNNHGPSFNANNTLPASNVYVKPKNSVGLLGDRPTENKSFDNSYAEYNSADNSFDDDNGFAEYSGVDNSFDDYSSYQSYDHDERPGGWNDNYQDFPPNTYQGNHFSESRDWERNRSVQNRRIGDRGTGNRGPINRGTGNGGPINKDTGSRGPINRGTGSRGPINRGTINRGTMNRGTINRGTMNRGSMNRVMNRGTGSRGAFSRNRRSRW